MRDFNSWLNVCGRRLQLVAAQCRYLLSPVLFLFLVAQVSIQGAWTPQKLQLKSLCGSCTNWSAGYHVTEDDLAVSSDIHNVHDVP